MSEISMTSRRRFLAGALGAAVGASALGALAAGEAAPAAPKMKLGLATYQWGMNWDIPTLIANMSKAKVYGVELRTQSKYKHGVEVELGAEQRAAVKKQFADSPVVIVSVACSERFDWPDAEKYKAAIEAAKGYLKLSADIGSGSVRVFPNQFNQGVPHEKTIEQIAKALNEVGAYAAGIGQRVDIEAHGPAGDLATMKAIMDQVTEPCVGVRLNCDKRDIAGEGLRANFSLVRNKLAHTVHLHNLVKSPSIPYQQLVNLLTRANWEGWALLENTEKEPDLVAALIEQREAWEKMLENAKQARGGRKGKKA